MCLQESTAEARVGATQVGAVRADEADDNPPITEALAVHTAGLRGLHQCDAVVITMADEAARVQLTRRGARAFGAKPMILVGRRPSTSARAASWRRLLLQAKRACVGVLPSPHSAGVGPQLLESSGSL